MLRHRGCEVRNRVVRRSHPALARCQGFLVTPVLLPDPDAEPVLLELEAHVLAAPEEDTTRLEHPRSDAEAAIHALDDVGAVPVDPRARQVHADRVRELEERREEPRALQLPPERLQRSQLCSRTVR